MGSGQCRRVAAHLSPECPRLRKVEGYRHPDGLERFVAQGRRTAAAHVWRTLMAGLGCVTASAAPTATNGSPRAARPCRVARVRQPEQAPGHRSGRIRARAGRRMPDVRLPEHHQCIIVPSRARLARRSRRSGRPLVRAVHTWRADHQPQVPGGHAVSGDDCP